MKTPITPIRLPGDLKKWINKQAKKKHTTLSAYIINLIVQDKENENS